MGSSISKNTDKENKKLEKDQQKVPNVTKPAKQNHQQEQQDRTILGNEPKPSVVVTNKYLHEKKSNLQTKQIKKEVIAAIEIGYTHSGYVFCLGKKYALEGEGLYCPNWEARDNGVVSFKTSTAILFRPDKSIHSIGYEAEEYVSRNQNESDSAKWFFFKNFMVEFYKLKDTAIEDLKIKDFRQNNVTMNAVDVISSFINQMKDKMINELARQQLGYNDNDIQWVLTTPGKLEPSTNQLMNTAATQAGITHDQLTLLQGPEAELMYNRTFTVRHLHLAKNR
ncbi:heat shock 70 kDa protein 12A-like isoform X2 [Mytilus californianus]|uniref:heat shock 70 kDa protein 12A-like isoform X2 n=1 Tax=Mytilus californianus TaxID=6549 RepID=UPI00224542E7|nr:heat shock 70 kDa protein 12A-like isoform X2 [Mytilus californianus]